MGCSPDAYVMTPKEIAEEKRATEARKEIREIPLGILTVGDIIDLINVYKPSYPYHTWTSYDTDVLVEILKKTGKWKE